MHGRTTVNNPHFFSIISFFSESTLDGSFREIVDFVTWNSVFRLKCNDVWRRNRAKPDLGRHIHFHYCWKQPTPLQGTLAFYLFSLPLAVVYFLLPVRLFLVSPSPLFFWFPCLPWWRILLFCVDATSPPGCLRAWKSAYSCPLSCVRDFFTLFFFSSFPRADLDLNAVCFIRSFCSGYYGVSSVSGSVVTRSTFFCV